MKETLMRAIMEAGELVGKSFNGPFAVTNKEGKNNLVTEIDQASERLINSIVKEAYPHHGFVGEEYGSHDGEAYYKWIVDPIDGTVNFAHGVPLCCISIGLMGGDSLLMGAVYNPMLNELFFAERGKGATLNGQPIHVSQKTDVGAAYVVTGFPYNFEETFNPITILERVVRRGIPVRRLGSAALDLCWVACGRFDAFWEYNLNAWDVAAGYLIVSEAGGKVTDFNNAPYSVWNKQTLATNGLIHDDLRKIIVGE
ncbi:MAG: inositol monophosphatase family protein [Edaphocola sp.]